MSTVDFSKAAFKPVAAAGARNYPVVSPQLRFREIFRGWAVRWGIGRDFYRVEPGLYACGKPTPTSPVLVSANYRLSFDALRKELGGIDSWILVLDTKGVNVWCAAGKGTFGTGEVIRRVASVGLASVVSHRVLVLPQLGAPGVAAHEVAKASGFRVVYGPVRARDIPRFLSCGMSKDDAMRRVGFGLADRLAVAPVEFVHAWPFLAAAAGLSLLISMVSGSLSAGSFARLFVLLLSPILVGVFAFPALLPLLPFRAFAAKGTALGFIWSLGAAWAFSLALPDAAAYTMVGTSVISFISMNFTGSSTYTNLTGASREVKTALPLMVGAAVLGTILGAARFAAALL